MAGPDSETIMTHSVTIRRPDDFHVHLRSGDMLHMVLPYTAEHFARGLVMPNLDPPVAAAFEVRYYRRAIEEIVQSQLFGFEPLMTVYLEDHMPGDVIRAAYEVGAIAGKLYPKGATTNSEYGVSCVRKMAEAFRTMEELDMVLCIHAEAPGAPSFKREYRYLCDEVSWIWSFYPKLRIVVEHISSGDGVFFIKSAPAQVAATITAHHLILTIDDVVGGKFNPHNFCKPVAKLEEDREILIRAAISGSPKFFFGSDSAPHDVFKKECCNGAAGVFSAPVALATLAEVFDKRNALDRLEAFTSQYGAEFYKLPLNSGSLTLERQEWKVPDRLPWAHGTLVPWRAGQSLPWKVTGTVEKLFDEKAGT